jgi:predicted dehydrogenase
MSSVGVGLVGAGAWGANVARAFSGASGARLRWICDLDAGRLARAQAAHPLVRTTASLDELLADPLVEAVAVAVDSHRHHPVARRALEAGRHVLVEKPMALSVSDAADLCAVARGAGRVLMVGHVLLHHPAVLRARELIAAGELGEIVYLHATRVGPGKIRAGECAWWSLAPHDVAVTLYLFGALPVSISATGAGLRPERPDAAFATLRFADRRAAHVHVSRLAPEWHRTITVVGTRKTLTFDEMSAERPLRIRDRSLTARAEVEIPPLAAREPLLAQCEHFVSSAARGTHPRGDGGHGLDVVRVLEAGARSMQAGGQPVDVLT